MNENEISDLIKHFDKSSIDQPIAWYANIDLNSELSSAWRKESKYSCTFYIW